MFAERILTAYLRFETNRILRRNPAACTRLPQPKPGRQYLLYAHVPFCESLCPYCSFNRFILDEERARSYFKALREEMRRAAGQGYSFHSMYVGGGTPTIMIDELAATIDQARQLFPIREVSCETNPNHLIPEVIDKLSGRVQRLSVGVQSFDDGLLKQMNRFEKFGSGREIFERLRSVAGRLPLLNVDMIFNFPSQSAAMLRRDIEMVSASGAEQVTFYPLMTSPTVARSLDHSIGRVSYDREARFYRLITQELGRVYEATTAWTFSRRGGGLIDEYIVDNDEYVGIGSGAFSYLDGALYVNTFSLAGYEQAVFGRGASVITRRQFNRRDQMRYRFMMDLFGLSLDRKRFEEDFNTTVERGLWIENAFLRLAGGLKYTGGAIELTPASRYLLIVMMREFFSGINSVRDRARLALLSEDGRGLIEALAAKQRVRRRPGYTPLPH